MAPLPLNEPAARIAFDLVVGIWVVLELRVRLRSHLNRQGSRVDRNSLLVVAAAMAAGLYGAVELASRAHAAAIEDGRWALFVVGLVVMGSGVAFRQWAVAVLGRFFTVDVRVHPGQTVVDRGPYRWVRHPAYTGLIVAFIGIGLTLGNWAALAVLAVVPTVGIVFRIRVEERALLEGLGDPYRRFASTRPHLFPHVW